MDPLRFLYDGPSLAKRRINDQNRPAIIERHDALAFSARMISHHELRIWFEPDWGMARRLSVHFPYCLIISIPVESDTPNLTRTPGWRRRPHNNAFV